MGQEGTEPTGPDFKKGFPVSQIKEGEPIPGQVDGESVLLIKHNNSFFAVGAICTHYTAPLADGILIGSEIRCPWHHARFDLRTGEAIGPPALNPISCYRTEIRGDLVFVSEKTNPSLQQPVITEPKSVVIVGAGAAGNAAAETLRKEGYQGSVILLGAEKFLPTDRPNLSKDYLAGKIPDEWIPLRSFDFYSENKIDLRLGIEAKEIEPKSKTVLLSDGRKESYDVLILATGSSPIRLPLPGADLPHVFYMRTLGDSNAILEKAKSSKKAVLVGASFIALEVASSLIQRNIEVRLVAPESRPLERILGPELGDFIRKLHEKKKAIFHLGRTLSSIKEGSVQLDDGSVLEADLVVAGVGVRPILSLAEQIGLKTDKGILVDEYLRTSDENIYAAGDIVRWPDPHTGLPIRVEHWSVAERQGQVAARNAIGKKEKFRDVPFFWSDHYEVPISYVGHAEKWDKIEIFGSIEDKNCGLAYTLEGKILAVATIYRDKESLLIEDAMEKDDQKEIRRILETIRNP
ncbi:pyridine nucleotide-disulfide oxidoreductase [Leptospira wolffii]|uniref:FAD-dependent oxidoreductase n=1 Tax=Leptospira wolffii TaxID=409998 RepID=UPI001082CB63|nr:FAD-dependent oxidoreductase [Leptospira wolffii]TGL50834.1 pyridine nucleotide-disulfide oxidoreductase [Leptospira wolffii]